MITPELLDQRRVVYEPGGWPSRWNRIGGLIDLMEHITRGVIRFPCALPLRICEVGVSYGVSTEVFDAFGKVDAVDNYLMEVTRTRFAGRDNVHLIEADSFAAAEAAPDGTYDLVYLDSKHDYDWIAPEIRAWLPKVRKGGWISGHDHCHPFSGVMEAVAEILQGPDHVFSDSSWLVKVPE